MLGEFGAQLCQLFLNIRDLLFQGGAVFRGVALLEAFEVASAVEGPPSLPERRVLRSAARALGREVDVARLGRVARELF